MEALRACFDANPTHRDVVKNIREKFEFDERPQKGIIVQASSISPQALSADNYMGVLHSHCMLAKVDGFSGTCVEWVREDDIAIRTAGGFVVDPGVYYLQVEEVEDPTGNLPDFQFWVDPLLTVLQEPLITMATGTEVDAYLMYAPVLGDSVNLYSPTYGLLLRGTSFILEAEQSLYIGNSLFGLSVGQVPSRLESINAPFVIVDGVNDVLDMEINGIPITIVLNAGTYTTLNLQSLADQIQDAFYLADVSSTATVSGSLILITSSHSIQIMNDAVSTVNPTLGFVEGFVPVVYEGVMTPPFIPQNTTLFLNVDGVDYEVDLFGGARSHIDIAQDIMTQVPSLTITTQHAGDYTLDATTGKVTFLHPFMAETYIIADYRYPDTTRGPFPIYRGEISNTDAIPGVVIAFGDQLVDGDVVAVSVEGTRSNVAKIYGGKAEVSMDIDIIARDSRTRNELADITTLYFWHEVKEWLSEEGILITNVSLGGKSEEPYDDNADDYFYTASVSLSMMTDWEKYVARPLFIRRITPYTYDQDAQRVNAPNGILLDNPKGLTLAVGIPHVYMVPAFERIR